MKLDVSIALNLKAKEVNKAVQEAARQAMKDMVVDIHNQAVKTSPWLTGHNRRSIAAEVSGMGTVAQGADAQPQRIVDDSKLEGAVYSTSGYGGYLETGTKKMAARPYMKPALDMHFTQEKFAERMRERLGSR